jgi:Asp-tRNA(Asn)/Glu-tRNA(Gln) amidotransferase A subunit family amidase
VNGLPVGVQIVGLPHGDEALLSVASWLEDVFGV